MNSPNKWTAWNTHVSRTKTASRSGFDGPFPGVWNPMKSVKYYENFSGWKYKWLTCLKGPAGHGTESRTVSTSMWRIMNWGLWLLKCGWVSACSLLHITHIQSWVVCLAAFTEIVGHPPQFHGPVEQNELLATGNRLCLSFKTHV